MLQISRQFISNTAEAAAADAALLFFEDFERAAEADAAAADAALLFFEDFERAAEADAEADSEADAEAVLRFFEDFERDFVEAEVDAIYIFNILFII